jgi:hypothetical protein
MLQIPFDFNGHMVSYPTYKGTLRDNYEFTAKLTLVDFERGRSAMSFIYSDPSGTTYSMFLCEFRKLTELYHLGILENIASVYGRWTFRKQGANFTITLIDAKEAKKAGDK